ncbi:MAG: helix-turn-helix domain-containing protein [Acholeplasmatales bacterium]|jgi:sugar diacid utilization regulator|nr:helix-turn-helix domain-containing protein [Acholeplasmatales bacterium]
MFYYYVAIAGIKKLNEMEKNILLTLIKEIMVFPLLEIDDDLLIAQDSKEKSFSWQEFINSTNSEFLSNLKLYESNYFNDLKTLKTNLKTIFKKDVFKETYNNDITLLYGHIRSYLNEDLKKEVFKSLYNDKEFLKSIKIYLLNNQNTSLSAKQANLHRNTIINRINKFEKITGYNLKNYQEAVFIYLLLKE